MKENNLPEGWKWVKLGEVCLDKEGLRRGPFGSAIKKEFFVPAGYKVYEQANAIYDDANRGRYFLSEEKYRELINFNVVPGDLIVSCSGTLGKISEIPKNAATGVINQALLRIRLREELVEKKFFLYIFRSAQFQKKIFDQSQGTAMSNLVGIKDFKMIEISLPPKPIQQAIVSKIEELFSELDKSIETLRLAQQQLKTYRQAVLKWAFEGKLTDERREENRTTVRVPAGSQKQIQAEVLSGLLFNSVAAEPPTNYQIVENHLENSELPEGWKTFPLNQVCKIIGGVTKGKDFKGKETIQLPYLRVANVQDGYLDLKEIKVIEVLPADKEKYKLVFGDILYTEGGDKDKLGRGTIWKEEVPSCIHQNHIFRARPLSKAVSSKYIAYFSQTKTAKNYFFKHGKQTTNLASINLTILSNLPLPLCSAQEQDQVVEEIESRLSVADKMEESITQSLQQAEALRQSILKKAFEGKII